MHTLSLKHPPHSFHTYTHTHTHTHTALYNWLWKDIGLITLFPWGRRDPVTVRRKTKQRDGKIEQNKGRRGDSHGVIRINGGEMKGSRDRGYYLSFNIAGKSSPFLPRLGGKTGLGDFLITRGPRLLCCRPVCMCLYVPYVPLCEQKEKKQVSGNGKKCCERELERETDHHESAMRWWREKSESRETEWDYLWFHIHFIWAFNDQPCNKICTFHKLRKAAHFQLDSNVVQISFAYKVGKLFLPMKEQLMLQFTRKPLNPQISTCTVFTGPWLSKLRFKVRWDDEWFNKLNKANYCGALANHSHASAHSW